MLYSGMHEEIDFEALDKLAWQAISDWPKYASFDPVNKGLDYSHLTRFFLWDKVGRAIRLGLDNIDNTLEISYSLEDYLNSKEDYVEITSSQGFYRGFKRKCKRLFIFVKGKIAFSRQKKMLKQVLRGKKVLYLPIYSDRLRSISNYLIQKATVKVVSNEVYHQEVILLAPDNKNIYLSKSNWPLKLYDAILIGLNRQNIFLCEKDQIILKKQVVEQYRHIQVARQNLKKLNPAAILVHTDNHYPFIDYVMLANQMSIPSIMLQHGLDCEHYFLDEPYASHILLWGKEREERYRKKTTNFAKAKLFITGNPEYDNIKLTKSIDNNGDYILWATRPHKSEKCYSVSRFPQEGIDILKSIISFLKLNPAERLLIKPHPFTFSSMYKEEIVRQKLEDRIKFVQGNFTHFLKSAKVVIVEDSTAALEAMFYGKPILHAHFAHREPVLPISRYGAGLPAYFPAQLEENLHALMHINDCQKQEMFKKQQEFINEYASNLDGKAASRCNEVIEKILMQF